MDLGLLRGREIISLITISSFEIAIGPRLFGIEVFFFFFFFFFFFGTAFRQERKKKKKRL